jgi:4-aminobutyrate aminotransferase/(S)-3-amino-2-methylpropionate transaminase
MSAIRLVSAIPGPKSQALGERRARVVAPGLATAHPIFISHAEGATMTDVDGNTYLDFAGGIGVMNVGHARAEVAKAIAEQAARLTHAAFQVAGYESYVAVCEALCRLAPGAHDKRALLLSTGAEAVENAIKVARLHTKRAAVLCFEHAFHGRTLLGMTLTGKAMPYKAGFGPFAPEVYRLPFPYAYRGFSPFGADPRVDASDPASLERALKPIVAPGDLAAIIIEPVLGEGGFLPAPAPFLKGLREFCDRHGALFIADEVQTGFARTGTMFACERLGIVPDLLATAKSIAGGLPLGAVVGRADVMASVHPGGLGGTFAGNPVACAAALESISILEQLIKKGRPEAVGVRIHERMSRIARELPLIGDVRGLGAMQAIELVRDPATREPATAETSAIAAAARARGVLLLSAGTFSNVIRFLAPLSISDEHLEEGLAVVEACLREAAQKNSGD